MARGRIFLSYRRSDAPGYAGRIYDRLNQRFRGRVFRDVEGIKPGADFVKELNQRMGQCRALVVVIGPRWLGQDGPRGPRIADDDDWVRIEVGSAVKRGLAVFPVLVQGAKMPTTQDVPADLAAFTQRQAVVLREESFDHGLSTLTKALESALGEEAPRSAPKRSSVGGWVLPLLGLGLAAVVCTGVGLTGLAALSSFGLWEDNVAYDPMFAPPAVEGAAFPSEVEGIPSHAVDFSPVGSWDVGELHLVIRNDGSFSTSSAAMLPPMDGRWVYNEEMRVLVLEGWVNGIKMDFVFQIMGGRGDTFDVTLSAPGSNPMQGQMVRSDAFDPSGEDADTGSDEGGM